MGNLLNLSLVVVCSMRYWVYNPQQQTSRKGKGKNNVEIAKVKIVKMAKRYSEVESLHANPKQD